MENKIFDIVSLRMELTDISEGKANADMQYAFHPFAHYALSENELEELASLLVPFSKRFIEILETKDEVK